MSKITGVHHIAVKPTVENYPRTVAFYTELLGMEVKQSWGDPQHPCLMVSCGDNSCMEILPLSETPDAPGGPLAHIAFATEDVDGIVETVRAAGYTITNEPRSGELSGQKIRTAFLTGPVGEVIELFCVLK